MTLIADQTVSANISQFTTNTAALANYSRCLIRMTLINVTCVNGETLAIRLSSTSIFHVSSTRTDIGPWNMTLEMMLYKVIGGNNNIFIALSSGHNSYSNTYTVSLGPRINFYITKGTTGNAYAEATGNLNFKFYAA